MLVAKDPTVCSIHFNKLGRELMNLLNIKKAQAVWAIDVQRSTPRASNFSIEGVLTLI